MTPGRRRIDLLLVERGVFESRARARAAIEAGHVRAGGSRVAKPSDLVAPDAVLHAAPAHPWVSRGGVKLAAALDAFAVDPAGLACLDVGASTGGFTEVLLSRGAACVHAVDVGRGQLHPSLLRNPRIVSHEATDIRHLGGRVDEGSVDLATVDVSFISLRLVLPELPRFLSDAGQVVALIKPQFEVGRAGLDRGGIVRDPARRAEAVSAIVALAGALGFAVDPPIPSPIAGGDGNAEFLMRARRG